MSEVTPTKLLEDPLLAVSLQGVHMHVSTKSLHKSSIRGFFYCIDPATGTITLLATDESCETKISRIELIFSHSIIKIKLDHTKRLSEEAIAIVTQKLTTETQVTLSPEELSIRREKLLNMLKESQLPYEESTDGKFTVASVAVISPPFTHRDIKCPNVLVYTRLKDLISKSFSV